MRVHVLLVLASGGALAKPVNDHALVVRQSSPANTTATHAPSSTIVNACAQVSAIQSSSMAAHPSATAVHVNATLATECLNSIPVNKTDASFLLQNFKAYLEFQSDKEYLKNPPTGYGNPGFDLDGVMNQIGQKLDAGTYHSEAAFQQDIFFALRRAYDGHLYWQSDILNGVFSFSLSQFLGLASVSADGTQDPELFFVSDLITIGESLAPRNDFKPSPVVKLNGMNVSEAVESLGLLVPSQDADARYNTMLYSLANLVVGGDGLTSSSIPPQRDYYQFDFANGSTVRQFWTASVLQDFTNVTDGKTAYEAFAPFASMHSDQELEAILSPSTPTNASTTAVSSTASTTPTVTAKAQSTGSPFIPFFPYPVVKDGANLIAGYFLNDTRFNDVAVLQITRFEPTGDADDDYPAQFSRALATFLEKATAAGKKKLVVDLQGNNGGLIDLGTDTYIQLFPNQDPNASSNMRRSQGMDIIIDTASAEVTALNENATAADVEANNISPFNYQYDIDPSAKKINSTQQLLNGITYNGTNFTTFFQTNYSDPLASVATGFEITPVKPSAKPPFAPEKIIVLTDGLCASTCTTFSEHMKNQGGVQFIVVGGRPQHQPVQALGGIKGSQIFTFDVIDTMHDLFNNATSAQLQSTKGTEWDNFTLYPIVRTSAAAQGSDPSASGGVNGRNAFRIGDASHTPLQYVYEAADCRIWFTKEMLYNPVALWNRVADVAFNNRTGVKFNSPYCAAGSTGHPTSISGGWQRGTLGPQDQGKIEAASPIFQTAPWVTMANNGLSRVSKTAQSSTSEFSKNCDDYAGDYWFAQLMCKASKAVS